MILSHRLGRDDLGRLTLSDVVGLQSIKIGHKDQEQDIRNGTIVTTRLTPVVKAPRDLFGPELFPQNAHVKIFATNAKN